MGWCRVQCHSKKKLGDKIGSRAWSLSDYGTAGTGLIGDLFQAGVDVCSDSATCWLQDWPLNTHLSLAWENLKSSL